MNDANVAIVADADFDGHARKRSNSPGSFWESQSPI